MSVHPYFTAKARDAMRAAGGDPDNAGPLAEWAEEAKRLGDAKRGVIIAEDGTLVASTIYRPGGPGGVGAAYVTREDAARYKLSGDEVGIAIGQISRQVQQALIHVTMGEVCRGAGDVPTGKPGRPAIGEPINIRLPADMLARIDAAAQTEGITRSEWMRRAFAERLAILTES